ncbi:hypothetical protein FRB93_003896 [Tulasnella sp. JGI-2019a]|nr:hypothetical protein FRB93_003896 [Tulasnella sp. JGI-2019a]
MAAVVPPSSSMMGASQSPHVNLSAVTDASGKNILISITPPAAPEGVVDGNVKPKRAPVDFVLTIDVSGSMADPANIPGDTEQSGLSILDIVKHAAKTIITSMQDTDRVGIVTFTTGAETVLGLTQTDDAGKVKALEAIESLRPIAATNIWEGLKSSLNVFKDLAHSGERPNRLSSIFLLTDGLPTITPRGGHIHVLKSYLDTHKLAGHVTINTFGFGYMLDSRLLHSMATIGHGTFGFIADAGMVGTVFVHAVANTYATYADSLEIDIQIGEGKLAKTLEVTGGFECTRPATTGLKALMNFRTPTGLKVFMNPLQYGQARDLVVKTSGLPPSTTLIVAARYHPWDSPETISDTQHISLTKVPPQDPSETANVTYHQYRSNFVSTVYDILSIATRTEEARGQSREITVPKHAKENFEKIVNDMEAILPVDKTLAPDAHALLADIRGQVLLAVSDETTFRRWGQHYLLSMARAHQRQTCINFKDVGLQVYGRGSTLFIACRDEIDALFDNLPPPKSTIVERPTYLNPPGGGGAPQQRMMSAPKSSKKGFSMASYNSRFNPCFAGWCPILLADGTSLRLSNVTAGVRVKTLKGPKEIVGVIKTSIEGEKLEMCEIVNGASKLIITPWHPIKQSEGRDGKWVFPADISEARMIDCDAVYSIILEAGNDPDAHGVYVGGTLCVTLGHGIERSEHDVRAHPFLGSYSKVSQAFKNALDIDGNGVVHAVGVERSEKTCLINGFKWK